MFTVAAESFSIRLPARRLQTALDSLSLFSKGAKLKSIVTININILEKCRCFVLVLCYYFEEIKSYKIYFFSIAPRPLMGKGFLSIDAARLRSDAPQSVGLLWTSDQLVAETST